MTQAFCVIHILVSGKSPEHRLSQHSDESMPAVSPGNAGTLIAFRLGAEDAPLIADELGHYNPEALTDTPNFAAWIKLMYGGSPTGARYMKTLPPPSTASGRLPAIQARTRARHARPLSVL